jgi:hypothetical protein
MAEKVEDEINGLHFRRGDAHHLAETIQRAANTPGLWEELQAGIPAIHAMDEHVTKLADLYEQLISERRLHSSNGHRPAKRAVVGSG